MCSVDKGAHSRVLKPVRPALQAVPSHAQGHFGQVSILSSRHVNRMRLHALLHKQKKARQADARDVALVTLQVYAFLHQARVQRAGAHDAAAHHGSHAGRDSLVPVRFTIMHLTGRMRACSLLCYESQARGSAQMYKILMLHHAGDADADAAAVAPEGQRALALRPRCADPGHRRPCGRHELAAEAQKGDSCERQVPCPGKPHRAYLCGPQLGSCCMRA